MGEAGILRAEDRVELIVEGEIVDLAPIGKGHHSAVDRLNELLVRRLAGKGIVRVQGSVRLNDRNEPQPDLVVLRRRDDFYKTTFAGPDDTLLVIEVADTSLAFDRDVKAPLYARTGITEFWLVDVETRTITVFREPGTGGYASVTTARGSQALSPEMLPDLTITPDDVVP